MKRGQDWVQEQRELEQQRKIEQHDKDIIIVNTIVKAIIKIEILGLIVAGLITLVGIIVLYTH